MAWSGLSAAYRQRIKYGFGDSWLDSSTLAARKAIELDPKLADPYVILGIIELARDNSEHAMDYFNQANSLDPNNSAALYQLGKINIDRKDYKDGISQLLESFRLNPDSNIPEYQSFYQDLGWLYVGAGMVEKGEELLRKQVSLYPNIYNHLFLNFILSFQKKWEESKKHMENVRGDIEANPNPSLMQLNALGFHYWWIGYVEEPEKNFKEAERLFTKILQILEDDYEESYTYDTNIRHRLADIWLKQGKEEQAFELLKEDLRIVEQKLKAGFGPAEGDIAQIHLLLGNKEECYQWLDKVVYHPIYQYAFRLDPIYDDIRDEPRFQAKITEFDKEGEKIGNALQEIEIEEQLKWVLER